MKVWPSAALGEVATIDRDGIDPARIEDGTLYVGLENIRSGGGLVDVAPVARGDLASTKFRITRDHVLFGKLRPYLAKVARPDFNGICSTDILPIRPGPGLDRDYLALFLLRPESVAWAASRSTGANLPRLSPNSLAQMRIPLPPLDEQRRIADVLDRGDTIRAKRRSALALLDKLIESVFLETFGDPGSNPRDLRSATMGELFHIARGGSPRPIDDYITEDEGGINWITIGDTQEGGKYITGTKRRIRPAGASRSRRVVPGDLLLTNSMSFGRPYMLQIPGCIHDGWLVLSPRDQSVNPHYFHCLLGSKVIYGEFARRAPGSTVKNLNIDLVAGVRLPVADAAEQASFARRVVAIEAVADRLAQSLVSMDALVSALQHRAFTGQL